MITAAKTAARARDNMMTVTIRHTTIIAITRCFLCRHPYNAKGNRSASEADMPAGLSNGPVTANEPWYDGISPENWANPHKESTSAKNVKRTNITPLSFKCEQIA